MKKNYGAKIIAMSKYSLFGIFLQMLFYSFVMADNTKAQGASITEIKLSLSVEGTIFDVFSSIENKTGFSFSYNNMRIDLNQEIHLKATNKPLSDILLVLSKESNLRFKRINQSIHVFSMDDRHERVEESFEAAQVRIISGTIVSEDGEGLPGVNVIIKGTSHGTITDIDGKYQIEAAEGATLVFSFVGYQTQEFPVGNRSVIDVMLAPDVKALEEVVVIGYGAQKKESVVSAIDQVSGADLERSGTPSITSALSGLSPGMNVIVQSGQPGAELGKIFIRGRSDFSNDQALVLVDGIEQTVDISSFDPSEIESISILKDAAATAVYGVKGANGVVIITTKRGRKQKPTIVYSGEATVKRLTSKPDMLNAYDGKLLQTIGQKNDQLWDAITPDYELEYYKNQTLPYIYPDVDWWGEIVKPAAYSQKHNLSLRGGNDFVKYYTAISYLSEGDIFNVQRESWMDFDPSFDYKRTSLRNNIDFKLTKTTELQTSFSGQVSYNNSPVGGNSWGLYGALYLAPNSAYPLYYPEEALEQYPDYLTDPYMDNPYKSWRRSFDKSFVGMGHPYNNLRNGQSTDKSNSLSSDVELIQKLDFLVKGLDIRGKFNYSSAFAFNQKFETSPNNANQKDVVYLLKLRNPQDTESYYWERSDLSDSDMQESSATRVSGENMNNKREMYYYRLQLNYEKTFGDHEVTTMGLFSRRKQTDNFSFPYFNEDWVSRLAYNYKTRYFAEFSGAYNGDEAFAKGYKFRFFPAFAVGWNIAKEKFIENNVPWLNNLKIRYSYGQTGSASGAPRWGYFGEYGAARGSSGSYGQPAYYAGWQFGRTFENDITDAIGIISMATAGATWAVTTKQNFGIDFSLLDSKIQGNVEVFNDYREGIFIKPQSIPSYVGLTVTPPKVGIGEIKKHGYEMSLTYLDDTNWGLSYSVSGAFGFNENRVVFNDDLLLTPEYLKTEGKPIATTSVHQVNGYFNSIDEVVNYTDFVAHKNPTLGDVKPVDYNADGVIDDNDKIKLDLNEVPLNNYSITLTGEYKRLSARIFCSGVFNYNMVEHTDYAYALYNGFAVGRHDQLDFWTPANTDAQFPALHANPDNYTLKVGANSQRVINMSYFRIKNVELSYKIKPAVKSGINSVQVYVNGNNLYTFSQFKYGDPEGKNVGSGSNQYPLLQRYNLGLRVTF